MLDTFAHGGSHPPGTEHPKSSVAPTPTNNTEVYANNSDAASLVFMGIMIVIFVSAVVAVLVYSLQKSRKSKS